MTNKNTFKDLQERGFLYQLTDETTIKDKLNNESVSFYVGFDPTGDSLHIGHLLPIMAAKRLQAGGHKPIMLVGGGTALVGDPSGKSTARPILTEEKVNQNAAALKKQLEKFIDFNDDKAYFVNNGDWLKEILYVDLLRYVGAHFSVNKMLSMDSVKQRLGTGISFLEFNYMILQAYDFLHLNEELDCSLQVGGQDQWGNIISGVELIRRVKGSSAYGATFPLLTDSSGEKFGKTAGGAVFLDTNKTSIFEYYQFWRNIEDVDVKKLLFLFTDLPTEEIEELGKLVAPEINRAKEILAFEATKMVHGEDEASKAFLAAGSKFGFADKDCRIKTSSNIVNYKAEDVSASLPSYEVNQDSLEEGIWIVALLSEAGLCASNGDARRLIKGGGAYLNGERISDMNFSFNSACLENGEAILKAGKKKIMRITVK